MDFAIKQKNKNDSFLLYKLIVEFYNKKNVSINILKNKILEFHKKFELSNPYNSNTFYQKKNIL